MSEWLVVRHRVALAGKVKDTQTGKPISGARVRITAGPRAFMNRVALRAQQYGKRWPLLEERLDQTKSHRDGHFHFLDLPEGTYTVRAELPGVGSRFGTVQQSTTLTRDAEGRILMAALELLLPPTTVKGQVSGPDAAPLFMAEVRVGGSNERVFTDSRGNYLLAGLEVGGRTLLFAAQGHRSATRPVTLLQAGEVATLNLELERVSG